jgi:hypothetical protein
MRARMRILSIEDEERQHFTLTTSDIGKLLEMLPKLDQLITDIRDQQTKNVCKLTQIMKEVKEQNEGNFGRMVNYVGHLREQNERLIETLNGLVSEHRQHSEKIIAALNRPSWIKRFGRGVKNFWENLKAFVNKLLRRA